MNGFVLNVVDFDDLSLEADDITKGLTLIKSELSEKLIRCIPPMPTSYQDLIVNGGEFVMMITV